MTGPQSKHREEMRRIEDSIVDDIMTASDTEILAEIVEEYGSVEAATEHVRRIFEGAVKRVGKSKLEAARVSAQAATAKSRVRVIAGSFDDKKKLFQATLVHQRTSKQQITLAARNADDRSESDLDSLLSDFVALGVIDEDGNLK